MAYSHCKQNMHGLSQGTAVAAARSSTFAKLNLRFGFRVWMVIRKSIEMRVPMDNLLIAPHDNTPP